MKSLGHSRQRGLSLVELMVGIAVGLFIVAASTMLVSTQLAENRRLLVETQIQQDLRATVDIITRELRRAGSWGNAVDSRNGIWSESTSSPTANVNLGLTIVAGSNAQVTFKSSRTNNAARGFQLMNGAIESRLDGAAETWQKLTDDMTLTVLSFDVAEQDETVLQLPCPKMCPGVPETTDCWPTVKLRTLVITLTGQAKNDPSVVRTASSAVRLRSDDVVFNNGAQACPA